MTGGDLVKLKNAGFRAFSKNVIKKTITESEFGIVKKFGGPYKTAAEMNRAWDELMKDQKHISR